MAELIGGAALGALVSVGLEKLIKEAKTVLAFKAVSEELTSTMEDLLPIVTEIESLQGDDELKTLKVTIDEAKVLVNKCLGVHRLNILKKNEYTKQVWKIQKDMLKFCQVKLQFIFLRNQAQFKLALEANNIKLDRLSALEPHVFNSRCSVKKPDKALVGFDIPLALLKNELKNGSGSSLLVSGAPGCGKTTLVAQLCHDEEIKGKFKHIFFNVVSSAPNFRGIVQNLFQHNGYKTLTFDNDSQATFGLSDLMEKLKEDGPILLVLDDVWHGAEFLINNFRLEIPDYKILVTSRSNFQDFSFTYHLKPLEDKYAKDLLIECASRPDKAPAVEYDDLLQKILKRCCGFPIVIEVVGSSLKGQPLSVWKGQADSWSDGETILDNANDRVLECLEPSFNALKPPRLKDCFVDMGSFLEDQKIRASVIIDIWVELYSKDSSSSTTVYMKYLNDLASRNLLKLIPLERKEPENGFYNEFLVTQHDVLRELAIRQSKLEASLDRKRFLSISIDDSLSSNWVQMEYPNVEALILNISSSNYALPEFISKMKKLKVVIIINHGFFPARLINFSCLSSLPNLKRIRLENVSITLLDILESQSNSLKKFSLVRCWFDDVSPDTKEIVHASKVLPRLEEIDIDYCYNLVELPSWVFEVVSLKILSITNCNKFSTLPEAIGNLTKLEVLRLCSCINLSELPETISELNIMRFLDISGCHGLKKLPLNIGKLHKLKKIIMRNWSGELPDSVRNLENLVVKCYEGTTIASLWKRLPKMINLEVMEEEEEHHLNKFLTW